MHTPDCTSVVARPVRKTWTIDPALCERAARLVNPASGIANDYLNVFFELLLLVENLPDFPEMIDDVRNWKFISYRDYFQRSQLPGRFAALEIYDSLDPEFRDEFEGLVDKLRQVAQAGVAGIESQSNADGEISGPDVAPLCAALSAALRDGLVPTTDLVNNGHGLVVETAQQMADRVLAGD